MTVQTTAAPAAPCTKSVQVARIAEAGISPSLAVALADLFFPATKRDDCALLAAVTADRVSASSLELR